jgi:SAM-dependent methyltransferase
MPLANGLVSAAQLTQPGESFPLMVAECAACSLAQLRYVVDPHELYRHYRFYSGASVPNVAYFRDLSQWIKTRATGGCVLEIGSNDGTLLVELEQVGFDVTGIDPAISQCDLAQARLSRGEVICDYWGTSTAYGQKGLFDVVVACNVLGHSTDLRDFAGAIKRVLKTFGLLVVEVQYLKSLLAASAFELIYHEHVSYFDEVSLARLLTSCGFKVLGWELTDAQCGTLRMWASGLGGGVVPEPSKHDWTAFRDGIALRHDAILDSIATAKAEGRRVCFYGAPAKATQIANYWRLGTDSIQFATDTTRAKQGMYIPGSLIPIVPPDHLQSRDAAIVAAWNHWPFIASQEAQFVTAGGLLINPSLIGTLS